MDVQRIHVLHPRRDHHILVLLRLHRTVVRLKHRPFRPDLIQAAVEAEAAECRLALALVNRNSSKAADSK